MLDAETELLMKISAEEVKSMLDNLVESKLSALQVYNACTSDLILQCGHVCQNLYYNKIGLLSKLKKNEETISGRLTKIEKNLNN